MPLILIGSHDGRGVAVTRIMKHRRKILVLFSVALSCALLNAQDAAAQKPFRGAWEAKFHGNVFCTVVLNPGEKMSGTVSTGRITVNDDGDLIEAEPSPTGKESDILRAAIDGDRLTFEIDDDGDLPKFEMTITGEGKAELRFVVAPGKIKPLRLERAS